jgi:hypothetical protein
MLSNRLSLWSSCCSVWNRSPVRFDILCLRSFIFSYSRLDCRCFSLLVFLQAAGLGVSLDYSLRLICSIRLLRSLGDSNIFIFELGRRAKAPLLLFLCRFDLVRVWFSLLL